MQTLPRHINPFALLLDPQAVVDQIEHSALLARLSRRICRPLDKPLLGMAADPADDGDDAGDSDAG